MRVPPPAFGYENAEHDVGVQVCKVDREKKIDKYTDRYRNRYIMYAKRHSHAQSASAGGKQRDSAETSFPCVCSKQVGVP